MQETSVLSVVSAFRFLTEVTVLVQEPDPEASFSDLIALEVNWTLTSCPWGLDAVGGGVGNLPAASVVNVLLALLTVVGR